MLDTGGALHASTTLVFDHSNYDREQTFVVRGIDDNFADGERQFPILFTGQLFKFEGS